VEKFKHSKEADALKGFEKKFYNAIVELADVVCTATKAKPKEVISVYEGDDNKILRVVATVCTEDVGMDAGSVENYINIISGHFPAFFTPSHFRPYIEVYGVEKGFGIVEIIGTYKAGV
jgi:hypothetical protein